MLHGSEDDERKRADGHEVDAHQEGALVPAVPIVLNEVAVRVISGGSFAREDHGGHKQHGEYYCPLFPPAWNRTLVASPNFSGGFFSISSGNATVPRVDIPSGSPLAATVVWQLVAS